MLVWVPITAVRAPNLIPFNVGATPLPYKGSSPAGFYTALSVGVQHNCAIRYDGAVYCWGDNTHGQIFLPQPVQMH